MHLIRQSRNRAEQEEILKVHRLVCLRTLRTAAKKR